MYALLLLFRTGLCASALAKSVYYYTPENAHIHFEEFITKFNKHYIDKNEREVRLKIFKKNLEDINHLNKQSEHAVYGITKFMDLTREEFIAKHIGLKPSDGRNHCDVIKTDKDIDYSRAPDSFDWRDQNAVTPVKDQGDSAACYAFSGIGHIESQYFLVKKHSLSQFSEQQMIDCGEVSNGCEGGLMTSVFKTLKKLGGPMKSEDYPYESKKGDCRTDKNKVMPKIKDCISYDLHKQESVKQLLYKVGPISIGIRSEALISYKKEIISDALCSKYMLNHAVLLVGYGTGTTQIAKTSFY